MSPRLPRKPSGVTEQFCLLRLDPLVE